MSGREHIYSRVTIFDSATLFVTESQGDFPSTTLEEVVRENVPGFTHIPPTVIVLEADINDGRDQDLPVTKMTPLVKRLFAAYEDQRRRGTEPDRSPTQVETGSCG